MPQPTEQVIGVVRWCPTCKEDVVRVLKTWIRGTFGIDVRTEEHDRCGCGDVIAIVPAETSD